MKSRILISLFLLISLIKANAANDYALTQYKIDVKVNDNNTFYITEHISANYRVPKHGIERLIRLQNKVYRLDGTKSYFRSKISDINVVGDFFSTYNESGNKVVRIGDPERKITGSKDYILTYLYDNGNDKRTGFDEFYFNLIGNEWDTTIDGIEFTITMPKDFDSFKVGFSSGGEGLTDNDNITFEVNSKVITGSYNGTLHPGEALTVRIELPEGYFISSSKNIDFILLLSFFFPIMFVLTVFGMWYKYGRDEKVYQTVEFYPPEGFNSAETGFLYKGSADATDVVSLLIYLAEKGYITISETEEKSLFSKKQGFKITKVKEYDGDNLNERLFLKGLFKSKSIGVEATFKELLAMVKDSDKLKKMKDPQFIAELEANQPVEETQEIRLDDLKNHFYTTLNEIVANLNKKENKETIFEKNSRNKSIYVYLMAVLIFAGITIKPMLEYGEPVLLIFGLIFPGIGFSIMFASIFSKSFTINQKSAIIPKIIFGVVFGVFFGLAPWAFIVLPALLAAPGYLAAYLVGLLCIALMLLINRYMLKRTPYGNEMLGKIRGFKDFLETAEKPKLEELVMQNPKYFYNILPFTYVLGVSDKWIKKFETISIQPPGWYNGRSAFSAAAFGSVMNSTMKSASSAMSSSPSSSGSSSGGGRSGGGSGGGGGRSW